MYKKVLIVDDYINSRKLLMQLLESLGCETVFAWHAAEAMNAACRYEPDLIIIELALPDAIGYDLVRCLRLLPEMGNIPIIITSYAGDEETALRNGATAYMQKPLDYYAVREKVREFLGAQTKKKGSRSFQPRRPELISV